MQMGRLEPRWLYVAVGLLLFVVVAGIAFGLLLLGQLAHGIDRGMEGF